MGLIKGVLSAVGFLVLVLVGLGSYLYLTDYAVDATITEKQGSTITLQPDLLPTTFQHTLDSQSAQFVCEGYQVRYHVNSGHTLVYDRQGRLVYDSETGLADTFAPVRCAALGL